jgi:hypothetical protein
VIAMAGMIGQRIAAAIGAVIGTTSALKFNVPANSQYLAVIL